MGRSRLFRIGGIVAGGVLIAFGVVLLVNELVLGWG